MVSKEKLRKTLGSTVLDIIEGDSIESISKNLAKELKKNSDLKLEIISKALENKRFRDKLSDKVIEKL